MHLTVIHCSAVVQAPVFTFLTSWPLEDLISPHNSINASTGDLFDRLEASVMEDPNASKRRSITCAHLQMRCKPKRSPPRVIVFTGPTGAAKRAIMAGLVAACPSLFARVVTHTSRRPKEHEVDGVDYHFNDAQTLRCGMSRTGLCAMPFPDLSSYLLHCALLSEPLCRCAESLCYTVSVRT